MERTQFTSSTQLAAPDALVDSFLARPRNTPSARNARARDAAVGPTATTGAQRMRAVFSRLSAIQQEPARQLAYERMVIEAKIAAMLERIQETAGDGGGEDLLEDLITAARDNTAELSTNVGVAEAKEILGAVASSDMRDALRLSVVSEEEAAELRQAMFDEHGGTRERAAVDLLAVEAAERLWRRRLAKITIPVRINAALRFATAHDDFTRTGDRSLINKLNKADPRDELSYYQTAALKYGRTARRRGSTGVAGAWEEVFRPETVAAYDRGASVSYGPDGAVHSPRPSHNVETRVYENGFENVDAVAERAQKAAARVASREGGGVRPAISPHPHVDRMLGHFIDSYRDTQNPPPVHNEEEHGAGLGPEVLEALEHLVLQEVRELKAPPMKARAGGALKSPR